MVRSWAVLVGAWEVVDAKLDGGGVRLTWYIYQRRWSGLPALGGYCPGDGDLARKSWEGGY
jgi:hypothetical protein